MKHVTLRRHVAALLLGATLAAPAAWAAEARINFQPEPKDLVLNLWGQLVALWEGAGSFIDPFGRQETNPEPAETESGELGEAGSFIDPFG